MGGYAFYVWSSYLVTGLVLGYLFFSPITRHRQLLQDLDTELNGDALD